MENLCLSKIASLRRVLESRSLGARKRRWKCSGIPGSFIRAQTVVIPESCGPTYWAYPYMLQKEAQTEDLRSAQRNSSWQHEAGRHPAGLSGEPMAARCSQALDTVVLSQSAIVSRRAVLEAGGEADCAGDPAGRDFLTSSILPVESVERRWRGSRDWSGPALVASRSTSRPAGACSCLEPAPKICLVCLPPPKIAAGWEAANCYLQPVHPQNTMCCRSLSAL